MTKHKKAAARKKSSRKSATPRRTATAVRQPPQKVSAEGSSLVPPYMRTTSFAKAFAWISLGILIATTLFWTVLTARLHELNADQLIDAYLFESLQTFQQAVFPGAHSFLIKWPLFLAISLLGSSLAVFMLATIVMVFITVGTLVYILYRIEKRPIVFGLFCLILASMLLLVPAQPIPGTLLPVNMAMTTTRNLEYVVYIAALYLALRSRKLMSYSFMSAMVLMILLIASDKLFAVLGIGGGIAACAWYGICTRRRDGLLPELRWLAAAAVGLIAATGLLLAIDKASVTNIGDGERASPYPLVQSASQLATGMIYSIDAIAANFGASAIHGTNIVRDIPAALLQSLTQFSTLPYTVNLLLLLGGLYACLRLIFFKQTRVQEGNEHGDIWTRLAIVLLGSTLTAAAVFVLTDHYYPVDARYMTIGLFAVFIAAAAYIRHRTVPESYVVVVTTLLILAIPIGLYTSWQEYRTDVAALSGKNIVANRVSEELERRNIDRLVGDYWDVTPIKAKTNRPLTIMPVDTCILPRQVLSSGAWFQKPDRTSAAYLAVKDADSASAGTAKQTPTYNGCSLARVVGEYGVPSERVSVGSTKSNAMQTTPDVLLLLYPDGIRSPLFTPSRQSAAPTNSSKPAAAKPPEIVSFVPFTEIDPCRRGTTLQVIAHQDDDLLFMNPDVSASIREGECIRTVYVTAGDAGEQVNYWGGRELGAKAAYAEMYGMPNIWRDEQQMLAGRKVSVSYLENIPQVSLVFLRLPDGNLSGQGFAGRSHESLQALVSGAMPLLHTVDGTNTYTKEQLVTALRQIMIEDLPNQIRTQGSHDKADGDHADHHDVGTLTTEAAASYLQPHELLQYLGYSNKLLPANLSDDDVTVKQSTFLSYAKFDGAVCQTAFECQNTYTYGNYLLRQYPQSVSGNAGK
ncbi:MAG TPA: PIG-L family deacetylase [Candidatus Saccharimonadales bacterium]|jgi:LmbE family N-acetylglucosaminyl deacetylase